VRQQLSFLKGLKSENLRSGLFVLETLIMIIDDLTVPQQFGVIDLKKKILGNWLFLCFDKKRWTFA
jgi:hypothetical protein